MKLEKKMDRRTVGGEYKTEGGRTLIRRINVLNLKE